MSKLLYALLCVPVISFANAAGDYAYVIKVNPPFGNKITVNDTIPCPQTGATCRVDHLAVNATLRIQGIKEHRCTMIVNAGGSLTVDTKNSYFCDVETTPANPDQAGHIELPKHF
jgi:endo-1,3(4)-beta-glucanase